MILKGLSVDAPMDISDSGDSKQLSPHGNTELNSFAQKKRKPGKRGERRKGRGSEDIITRRSSARSNHIRRKTDLFI